MENWTAGAFVFDGRSRYCVLTNQEIRRDYAVSQAILQEGAKQVLKRGNYVYSGSHRRTVDMDQNNFLVEVYLRTTSGHRNGVIVAKVAETGYALSVDS